MKTFFVYLADAIAVIGSLFLGIFSCAGVCGYFWTPAIFDGGLTNHPEWTTPASVTFVTLLPFTMLLGAMGAFAGIVLPLHFMTHVPLSRSDGAFAAALRRYFGKVIQFIESDAA
jgi:hypothetical protein